MARRRGQGPEWELPDRAKGEAMTILIGDCLDHMRAMPDNSIDAICTDPPYGLKFMGKDWDHGVPAVHFWQEMERVLKPGGHLLAFGGTRTFHRLAVAIEDAGFEIRDTLMWLYGSGFPKSLDVSKAIDKAAGAERETWEVPRNGGPGGKSDHIGQISADRKSGIGLASAPATDAARQWDGWGTALKPAYEPIIMARKPLIGTVAANVLQHGTGALNIGASRVGYQNDADLKSATYGVSAPNGGDLYQGKDTSAPFDGPPKPANPAGRWPPNVILDPTAADLLDAMSGERKPRGNVNGTKSGRAFFQSAEPDYTANNYQHDDPHHGASRFFPVLPVDDPDTLRFLYQPKASRAERNAGLEGMPERAIRDGGSEFGKMTMWNGENGDEAWRKKNPNHPSANHHPTVKPIAVMRWLVRLVTPPNGTVYDPFAGSGTTGIAAVMEGFDFILSEMDPEYAEIAERRIAHHSMNGHNDQMVSTFPRNF
jgi:site-specific DNA-methyltransferase (adenine-specific)